MVNLSKIIGGLCLSGLALVSSCGTAPTTKSENAPQTNVQVAATPAASDAKPALPQLLVARVPVGADGQELNDQAEIREIKVAGEQNESSISAVFAAGETVVVDELDGDSSSQQWFGYGYGRGAWYWNTGWYPGKLLGRGLWWGRNPYRWYGGVSYPYQYNNSYYSNGCNYYSYGNNY